MLIYKCSMCSRIFGFPSPSAFPKCRWCGGRLVPVGEDYHPSGSPEKETDEKKGKVNGDSLRNLLKTFGTIWGTGGTANLVIKFIKKEKIGKGDLFHTIFPWATALIIHCIQHPQGVKNFFASSPPQIGMPPDTGTEGKLQKAIQIVKAQQLDKGSQGLPELSTEKAVTSNLEQRENLMEKLEQVEKLVKRLNNETSRNTERMEDSRALQWLRILSTHPRILILGGQGTGKSCLAFWLLEILNTRCPCFTYRLPEEGASFVPSWLGIIYDLNHARPGSIVLVDEAYLSFFSRASQSRQNRELSKIVNLARQKNLSLIFVAHEARHIDRNILSCIDTLVIKRPAPLQVELDRSFLRTYLLKAQRVFKGKSDISSRSTSYVCFSPYGFEGVLENPKPSFWSEKLSHIFALGDLGKTEKPAQQLSTEEKKKRARKLRYSYGYSYGKIAKQLGIGKTSAYRWLNEDNKGGTNR